MEKVFKIAMITCLCLLSYPPYQNIFATARPRYHFTGVLKRQMNYEGGGKRVDGWWAGQDYSLPHRRIPMHNDFEP